MSFNFNSFNSHPNFGSNSSRSMANFGYNFHNDSHVNYGQPTLGFGQIGLSQRVSDWVMRSNFPSPQRVHFQSVIDYEPLQNQPGINEVTVTEVLQTKFLTSNSTRDRLLTPNDHMISSSQQPIFQNLNLSMSNQPNQMPADHSYESIYDNTSFLQNWAPHHQSFNVPNPLTTQNDQPSHNTYQSFTQKPNQVNESVPVQNGSNQNPSQKQPNSMIQRDEEILNPEPLNVIMSEKTFQDLAQQEKPNRDDSDLVGHDISTPIIISDDNNSDVVDAEQVYDGRIHSLSRNKYGPYLCPKCNKEFLTSQSFAAHVVSAHYKYETMMERKKRHAAKNKKRKSQRAKSRNNNGLKIVPYGSFKNTAGERKEERGVSVKIESDDAQL